MNALEGDLAVHIPSPVPDLALPTRNNVCYSPTTPKGADGSSRVPVRYRKGSSMQQQSATAAVQSTSLTAWRDQTGQTVVSSSREQPEVQETQNDMLGVTAAFVTTKQPPTLTQDANIALVPTIVQRKARGSKLGSKMYSPNSVLSSRDSKGESITIGTITELGHEPLKPKGQVFVTGNLQPQFKGPANYIIGQQLIIAPGIEKVQNKLDSASNSNNSVPRSPPNEDLISIQLPIGIQHSLPAQNDAPAQQFVGQFMPSFKGGNTPQLGQNFDARLRSEVAQSYSSARGPNDSISDDGTALYGHFKFSPPRPQNEDIDQATIIRNEPQRGSPRATKGRQNVKHTEARLKSFAAWRNRDCCRQKILNAVKIDPTRINDAYGKPQLVTPKTPVKSVVVNTKDVDLSVIDQVVKRARIKLEVPSQAYENHRRLFTTQVQHRTSNYEQDSSIIQGPFQDKTMTGQLQDSTKPNSLALTAPANSANKKKDKTPLYEGKQFQYRWSGMPGVAGFMQYRKSSTGNHANAHQQSQQQQRSLTQSNWNPRASQASSLRSPRQKARPPVFGNPVTLPANRHPVTSSAATRQLARKGISNSQRKSSMSQGKYTAKLRKNSQLAPTQSRKNQGNLEAEHKTWSVFETEGRGSPSPSPSQSPPRRARASQNVTIDLLDCPETKRGAIDSARIDDQDSQYGQFTDRNISPPRAAIPRTIQLVGGGVLNAKGEEKGQQDETENVLQAKSNMSSEKLGTELESRFSTVNVAVNNRCVTTVSDQLVGKDNMQKPQTSDKNIDAKTSSNPISSFAPGGAFVDRRQSANPYPNDILRQKLQPVNQEVQQARVRTPNNASSNRRVVIRKITKANSPSNHDISDVFAPKSAGHQSSVRASTPIPADSRKQFDKLDNMIQAVERGEPNVELPHTDSEEDTPKNQPSVFAPIKMYSFVTFQQKEMPLRRNFQKNATGGVRCQTQMAGTIQECSQDNSPRNVNRGNIMFENMAENQPSRLANTVMDPYLTYQTLTTRNNTSMHHTSQASSVMEQFQQQNQKPLTYQYGVLGSTHHSRQQTILRPMQRLQREDMNKAKVNTRTMDKTFQSQDANALRKASARNPAQLRKFNKTVEKFADFWGQVSKTTTH